MYFPGQLHYMYSHIEQSTNAVDFDSMKKLSTTQLHGKSYMATEVRASLVFKISPWSCDVRSDLCALRNDSRSCLGKASCGAALVDWTPMVLINIDWVSVPLRII